MAPSHIYPPPATAHRDCSVCSGHYLDVSAQHDGTHCYVCSVEDSDAERMLREYRKNTNENLEDVKDLLVSHGDEILAQWKKYTREKRARVIRAAGASTPFTWVIPEPGTWKESQNMVAKWLDLDSLAQDHTKLLSLLYLRTVYEPHSWAPFDTRSSYLCFATSGGVHLHNAKSVVMHGKCYGTMKNFDVNSAHGWAEIGFPRAAYTFRAQLEISILLKNAANLVTANVKASGNSSWTSLISQGLHSAHEGAGWGSYNNQEFAPPTQFNPDSLLEKARNHLNILVDEIELMQTNPEHMRQYILEVKASTHFGGKESTDVVWAQIARTISTGWTTEISRWQRIVTECENLKTTLAESGVTLATGARLTKDADTAVRCFGETVHSWLLWTATTDFECLRTLPGMQASFKKFDQKSTGDDWDLEKILDPNKQNDRVLMGAYTISCVVASDSTSGISWRVQRLKGELSGFSYSKRIENWLSGMALLDELYGSWYWRQMTDFPDPLDKGALQLDVRSRDMLPSSFEFGCKEHTFALSSTADDVNCGQLMRKFCDTPLPKGTKNSSWLMKMTEARKSLNDIWRSVRTVFNERQVAIGRSELFRTSILSQMSFDESSEHIAMISAERQKIEDDNERGRALKKMQQDKSPFVQQAWDMRVGKDDGVRRTLTRKTNAARSDGTVELGFKQLALSTNPSTNNGDHCHTSASMPTIAVKQDTMSVISKMFPTGADGSSGVRWTQLLQALVDAGLTVTQGAGSAVSFASKHGTISIHQPHDRDGPIVDAIRLRGLGRRFRKWFGWTYETFVLRQKGDMKSEEGSAPT